MTSTLINNKCGYCAKPSISVPCDRCYSTGRVRFMVVFKRACSNCEGTGAIMNCPDEEKHFQMLRKKFHLPTLFNFSRLSQQELITLLKGENVHKPWDRAYKNPWHPKHPGNISNLNNDRGLSDPNNPLSIHNINHPHNPRNPNNPANPNSMRNPHNPQNPNSFNNPNHPFNRR